MSKSRNCVLLVCYVCTIVNGINLVRYAAGEYRSIGGMGWIFEVVFIIEAGGNLISDISVIYVLQPAHSTKPEAFHDTVVSVLNTFFNWNVWSTLYCYGANIALSHFYAYNVKVDSFLVHHIPNKNHMDEKTLRGRIFTYIVLIFTITAAVKSWILYYVFHFKEAYRATGGRVLDEPDACCSCFCPQTSPLDKCKHHRETPADVAGLGAGAVATPSKSSR